jgi:hypothetical protein
VTALDQLAPPCGHSQVWDLMQLAYQLGIGPVGERVHCGSHGAHRWDELSAAEAEDLTWALRRALLHDLDHGGHLVPPKGRFYEPAERTISRDTLAWWRRHLRGEDGRTPPY